MSIEVGKSKKFSTFINVNEIHDLKLDKDLLHKYIVFKIKKNLFFKKFFKNQCLKFKKKIKIYILIKILNQISVSDWILRLHHLQFN